LYQNIKNIKTTDNLKYLKYQNVIALHTRPSKLIESKKANMQLYRLYESHFFWGGWGCTNLEKIWQL